jgi:hypothetical protein
MRYRPLACVLVLAGCLEPNKNNGANGVNVTPSLCVAGSGDGIGCACSAAGATQTCWPGDPAKRGSGSCHDGTQTCIAVSGGLLWGTCDGANVNECGGAFSGCGAVEFATCDGGVPPTTPDPGMCGGAEFVQCDGGLSGKCTLPVNGRCPNGDYFDKGQHLCCPCDATTCNRPACCAQPACGGDPACVMCNNATLDPACGGTVDTDCDDFPEDCDQLCCPCKPGVCTACPMGQIPCGGVCVNAYNDPTHCGACDHQCNGSQTCQHGVCM